MKQVDGWRGHRRPRCSGSAAGEATRTAFRIQEKNEKRGQSWSENEKGGQLREDLSWQERKWPQALMKNNKRYPPPARQRTSTKDVFNFGCSPKNSKSRSDKREQTLHPAHDDVYLRSADKQEIKNRAHKQTEESPLIKLAALPPPSFSVGGGGGFQLAPAACAPQQKTCPRPLTLADPPGVSS